MILRVRSRRGAHGCIRPESQIQAHWQTEWFIHWIIIKSREEKKKRITHSSRPHYRTWYFALQTMPQNECAIIQCYTNSNTSNQIHIYIKTQIERLLLCPAWHFLYVFDGCQTSEKPNLYSVNTDFSILSNEMFGTIACEHLHVAHGVALAVCKHPMSQPAKIKATYKSVVLEQRHAYIGRAVWWWFALNSVG